MAKPKLQLLPQRVPSNVADPIGRAIGRAGVTPNAISVLGFAGVVVAAWLVTRERLIAAGVVFVAFSALDLLDGAVARATGKATPYGAVLDAVLDRAGEIALLAGCAWYFAVRGEQVQVALTFAALLGSVSVSYMRARAECAGMSMREGLFRRQERVALLTVGLLLDGLTVVIGVMAVLTNLTALQRFTTLARGLRKLDAKAPGP
ncbi:MAG: CDP-alcohol phosphatidyltransferase family protein [Dehalococcoidia bacterium]